MNPFSCRRGSSRRASASRFTAAEIKMSATASVRPSFGRPRECPWKPRRAARLRQRVRQMFKQKQSKSAKIDTLIGAKTRINSDLEFNGGLHLDGYINGNVKGELGGDTF